MHCIIIYLQILCLDAKLYIVNYTSYVSIHIQTKTILFTKVYITTYQNTPNCSKYLKKHSTRVKQSVNKNQEIRQHNYVNKEQDIFIVQRSRHFIVSILRCSLIWAFLCLSSINLEYLLYFQNELKSNTCREGNEQIVLKIQM